MKTETKTAEEIIKEAAWKGFKAAANAFRLYPDGKHAFGDHWFPETLYAEQIEDVKNYASQALDIAAEEAKWTSVKNGLPIPETPVLVTDGEMMVVARRSELFEMWVVFGMHGHDITHWKSINLPHISDSILSIKDRLK